MRLTSYAGDCQRARGGRDPQRGATVVEFLGVMLLVAAALLVLVQFSFWVWTRNVVVNATDEGARAAAESGRSPADGEVRARAVLHDGLGASAAGFRISASAVGDAVVIRAEGRAPRIVPFLPEFTVGAEARAFDEDRVLDR